MKLLMVAAAIVAAGATSARAQSVDYPFETGFVAVYGGAQPQRHTLTATQTQSIYEETATVTSTQRIRNGGLLEFGGGYRVRGALAIGARFSMFGRPGTSTVEASVPNPIFFDRPTTVQLEGADLAHRERGIHLNAIWLVPVNDKFDVALSAGPSFIHVSQELTSSITVDPSLALLKTTETGNAVGVNVGVDGNYRITPRYAVGLFIHYAAGSVDLPSATDVKVGGTQVGLGFHVRF
jgi:hypothetical protein